MPSTNGNRWPCNFEGCGRSFTRHEHLQRHVLNHAEGDFTCERCRAHFKRPDLLERHLARHRQKDAEGGTLMTRKRLWKDADGSIVTKRPALGEQGSGDSSDQGVEVSQAVSSFPPSPPSSSSDPAISPTVNNATAQLVQESYYQSQTEVGQFTFDDTLEDNLFWENSTSSALDAGYGTGPFDDIFAPDTASSFNMPYTTASNYNWLFDLGLDPSFNNTATLQSLTGPSEISQHSDREIISLPIPEMPRTKAKSNASSQRQPGPREVAQTKHKNTNLTVPEPTPELTESPMCFLNPRLELPVLDDMTRERVMDIIERARPTMPDGSIIMFDNPLLCLASLQKFLDLFFTRFNITYPLIHVATFSPSQTEPLLLATIILLGATYGSKDDHQLAVCIHDVLRPQIFANPSFNAKPELWVLQAILLTECLGKSRGGQKQHDMSHLFHGLLINLIRRSDCQSVHPEQMLREQHGSETQWRVWAELEEKKRLAQLCFVWDVQHAVLFSQSLCMSAFELRSTLPCAQSVWEATSASEWMEANAKQKQQPLHLLAVLKLHLAQQAMNKRPELNAISRMVILHALMSISWDMRRRDDTSLGMLGDSMASGSWRDRISKAYDMWKADFDDYATLMEASLAASSRVFDNEQQVSRKRGLSTFIMSYNSLYFSAQLILFAEILDLQIYAGARHILGRPVCRADYSRSQGIVKRWANDDARIAAKSAWYAAHIIKESLAHSKASFIDGDVFHHPWAVFLGTLTIWSFFHARPASLPGSFENDDEMIWDSDEHMRRLLSSITTCSTPETLLTRCPPGGKNCTAGLASIVVGHLSKIRWGVVHDGMLVLKGLVPWRLISEDDGCM